MASEEGVIGPQGRIPRLKCLVNGCFGQAAGPRNGPGFHLLSTFNAEVVSTFSEAQTGSVLRQAASPGRGLEVVHPGHSQGVGLPAVRLISPETVMIFPRRRPFRVPAGGFSTETTEEGHVKKNAREVIEILEAGQTCSNS